MEKRPVKVRVWLVHGTWARQSGWTQEGSSLRRALQEGLKGDVTFETFPWTGRNKELDRIRAAVELASSLKANSTQSHMTFLVAHSHGGNIAATADYLDKANLERKGDDHRPPLVDGIVTLNTPFLSFIPRDRGAVWLHSLLLGLCISVVLLQMLPLSSFLASAIAAAFWITATVVVLKFFEEPVGDLIALLDARIAKGTGWQPAKMLALCAPDDEAFGGLEALDTVLNAPYLMFHKVALPATILGVALMHYIFRWDFLGVEWIVWTMENRAPPEAWAVLFGRVPTVSDAQLHAVSTLLYARVFTFPYVLVFLASVLGHFLLLWTVLSVGSLLTTYLVRAIAFGESFGATGLLRAFGSRLKVSLTPLYQCNAQLVIVQSKFMAWLRHSDIYDNRLALKELVKWMNEQIEARSS